MRMLRRPLRLLRRLRALLGRPRRERELEDEVAFHLEMLVEENLRAGMSPAEARLAARRAFGGVDQVKEECRDARGGRFVEWLLQDVRFGWRVLRRSPGFTLVAVLTLALGIGANAAMFGVVHAVLLKPLPFDRPDQLVAINTTRPGVPLDWVSAPDLRDWRSSRSLGQIAGYASQSVNFTGRAEPMRVVGMFVTTNFFATLGVRPSSGRDFVAGEDEPGAARVAILGRSAWQTIFGGDPAIVGKTLTFNGQPFTVVGIMPAGLPPWFDADVYLPMCDYPNFSLDRAKPSAAVVGRLRDGVTLAEAQAELTTVARQLAQHYPATNRDRGVVLRPLADVLVEDVRSSLLLLLGAVGLVLLIACANVSNLLLSRAASRQRELAVRTALGAGRRRLVRQLLTESLLLWGLGALAGLGLAGPAVELLVGSPFVDAGTAVPVTDRAVLGFTLGLSLVTGLVFGLLPALQTARVDLHAVIKESGRTMSGARGRRRVQSLLVVAQVALAVILVTGAGLVTRSLMRLNAVDPGFGADHLLTLEYRLPRNKYPKGDEQWNFHKRVVERVQALAGVRSAAVVRALPFSGNAAGCAFVLTDRAPPPAGQEPHAELNVAHPRYFETMEIPILRGRGIGDEDGADAPPVVVINRAMAQRYWPDGDPIGKTLELRGAILDGGERRVTIVGVVGDIKHGALDDPTEPQIYTPQAQLPFIFATLVVRTEIEPMALADEVRRAVWSVDPEQPVWKVRTMESLLSRSLRPRSLTALLLGIYSGVALLLAALGIYGVIAYVVSQRTNEIGIRMALGAPARQIVRAVVAQGLALAAWGIGVGCVGTLLLGRIVRSQLFGVSAADPLTFAGVLGLLAVVALLASWIPARRATRIDPASALRAD